MATLVKFKIDKVTEMEDNSIAVFAYFSQIKHSFGFNVAYSRIGQHSPCHKEYAKECRSANESEYSDLKSELESIGYNLKICK